MCAATTRARPHVLSSHCCRGTSGSKTLPSPAWVRIVSRDGGAMPTAIENVCVLTPAPTSRRPVTSAVSGSRANACGKPCAVEAVEV